MNIIRPDCLANLSSEPTRQTMFDTDKIIVVIIVGVIIALTAAMVMGASDERSQWEAFSASHSCKIVSKTTGNTLLSPVFSGKGGVGLATTYVPGKTGYLCNDGVTYYR